VKSNRQWIGWAAVTTGQQHLRSVLGYCDSPQMTAPEAYIEFTTNLITDEGEVTNSGTEKFLGDFMDKFADFITHVLTVPPRDS
jgi:chromate reductase